MPPHSPAPPTKDHPHLLPCAFMTLSMLLHHLGPHNLFPLDSLGLPSLCPLVALNPDPQAGVRGPKRQPILDSLPSWLNLPGTLTWQPQTG